MLTEDYVRRLQFQERWRIDEDDPDAPLLGFFNQSQVVVFDGHASFALIMCDLVPYDPKDPKSVDKGVR